MRLPQIDESAMDTADIDGVYVYATEFLTLGLLWHGFHDSIKEGDSERILRYWKFLLVVFKATRHHNYAVNLLLQVNYHLSGRESTVTLESLCEYERNKRCEYSSRFAQ